MSAAEIVEHSFLAVEPEVRLVTNEEKNLTLQVILKGVEQKSVQFPFHSLIVLILVDTDTAEEVVNEMINENVLPAQYKHFITGEINKIIREMNKPTEDSNREEAKQWHSLSRIEGRSSQTNMLSDIASMSRRQSVHETMAMDIDIPKIGLLILNRLY